MNVTLIFSLERYEQVIDAYIEGIAQADANGHDLKHIGSVASFFVSRVDTAVDKLLEANGSDEAKALEGKAAVANARLAYELFEKKFAEDPRWAALEAKGAKSSVRCGPPPAPRTPPTPTASTSTSSLLSSSSTPCRRRP